VTIDDAAVLVNAALRDAARGWRVHPVHGFLDGRCMCNGNGCEHPGKHPRLARWPQLATTDPQRIQRWWSRWPTSNVGIATGGGLLVLDADGDVGIDSLHALEHVHGPLPETPRSLTGGGGLHFFLTVDHIVSNKVGLAPGIDIRCDGGFVVGPPSVHASGRRYAWDLAAHPDDVPLAPAPSWLLDLCAQPTARPRAASGDELRLVEGQRNRGLFIEACRWRRHGIGAAAIREMLTVVNRHHVHPPLPERELMTIAASAARYAPGNEDDETTDLLLARALGVTT
jgi:hypothetical protein